jgi:long-chain acyl-CoA synthetase
MAVYMLGILVPVFLSIWFSKREKKSKDRAVTVEVGGEKGLTKRNWRFEHLLETPWEGADTLAIIFEQTCARHCDNLLLGTRILISRETEVSEDGRAIEKVTLGHYEWTTYGQAFRSADDFASGLVAIGHKKGERVAIFAETRAEWFLALQACFRRNLTVVTIYASLGEEALVHSLNEVTPKS